jgi:hypothetical protein
VHVPFASVELANLIHGDGTEPGFQGRLQTKLIGMDQRFQDRLLNDVFGHRVASRQTTNHAMEIGKMLRDAIPEILVNGH